MNWVHACRSMKISWKEEENLGKGVAFRSYSHFPVALGKLFPYKY